jgi:hypothetical protein
MSSAEHKQPRSAALGRWFAKLAPIKNTLLPLGVSAIIAFVGLNYLMGSYAATSAASVEAEDGTVSGHAAIKQDNLASGQKSVQFPSAGTTSFTPAGMRILPDPLYGVTLDNANGIGTAALNNQVTALSSLARKPITRIVFDENTTPTGYTNAINTLQPNNYLMGEISDSLYMKTLTVQQYQDRTTQFVNAFGSKVDLWEVGNEVNGDWTGTYSDVGAKITAAYNVVHTAGKRTELTLWYDPNCGSPQELDPLTFSNQYVPASVRSGLDYVLVSYYETECNNYRPTAQTLTTLFTNIHNLYPNARVGFGEVGLPDYVISTTLAKAQSIATYYYGLNINLPYYVGGYFWWGFAEDGIPSSKPMWSTINTGMQSY